jgi:hypothetical protein
MSTARHGISDHIVVESIERLTKWLQGEGFSPEDALRGAVQMSLILCGDYGREEAREAAIEIVASNAAPSC